MKTKNEILELVKSKGYSTDFTLNDDCLYCSAQDREYLLSSFKIDAEYPFTENNKTKTLKAVSSTEYNLSGYFIN